MNPIPVLQALYKLVAEPLLDFIYPPLCFVCEQGLVDAERVVCARCWTSFPEVRKSDPVWTEQKTKFAEEEIIHDILSCYLFEKEGALQQVVHLLKYQGIKSLGVRLGRDVGKRFITNQLFSRADYLLPIPLHKLKQRERGYNQSEFICKGISEITTIPVNSSLVARAKYTRSQTRLNIEERRENVDDAFRINPKFQSEIKGKAFVLVDDVITTGSTMNACARELLNNGARTVLAASAALAK